MMEQQSSDKPVGVSPNFSERQREREHSAEITATMMKMEAKRFGMNNMQYANLVNGFLFKARRDDIPPVVEKNPSNSGRRQKECNGSEESKGRDIPVTTPTRRREVPEAEKV